MYIIVQFPLADLRPLVPGQKGRLLRPDWTNPNLAGGFIRGFGKVAERNKSSLGLEGEGISADFIHALKFPRMIDISDAHWSKRLHANVWFRRLYFDGKFSGRFEIGFILHDGEADMIYHRDMQNLEPVELDIARSVLIIENAPVEVVSPDTSVWRGKLIDAGKALALAYITATTDQAKSSEFSASEIHGTDVIIGDPRTHVRTNKHWLIKDTNDKFVLDKSDNSELYITSATGSSRRKSVLVQKASGYSSEESPSERVVRVLFAHLNSLIFAQNHFIENYKVIEGENKHSKFSDLVSDMISRFSGFAPEKEKGEKQKQFLDGLKQFGLAYERRIPDLLKELEDISEDLAKPSTVEKGLKALKSLYEVVVRATVEKTIDVSMGR